MHRCLGFLVALSACAAEVDPGSGTDPTNMMGTERGPCPSDIAQPVIAPNPLPAAQVGVPYEVMLELQGGDWAAEFVRWLWNDGVMPPGLIFEQATGRIHGTPTQAGVFDFLIQANDMGGPCIPPPVVGQISLSVEP